MSTAPPILNERLAHQQQHHHHHHADSSAAVPRELQCGYRSKVCNSVRATKLDGTLHKLCEFHRLKANSSQRRLQKRRQMRKLEEAATGKHARDSDSEESTTSAYDATSRPTKRGRVNGTSSPTTADDTAVLVGGSMPYEFNPSEVAILEQTLFSSSSSYATDSDAAVSMPAPLGLFDFDMVVADVLREFTGPVAIPAIDASSSWCWTV